MAPEIMNSIPYNSKVDIYSLGVVLFEMLYGRAPYETSSIQQLVQLVRSA